MTSDIDMLTTPPCAPDLLEKALEKNQEVKDKMVDCAAELATVNEIVKRDLATGMTLEQAKAALAHNESVEDRVQECADELHEVNEALTQEIGDREKLNRELKEAEQKLSATKNVLSTMEDDLARAREIAEAATQRTLHDFVTGIPNRELFKDRLEQAIALAERSGVIIGVMFIDLDKFKQINDTHGHTVGDKVLQEVAHRLKEQMRRGDTICRYGGDEFLYLVQNPQNKENIERIARKVLENLSKTLDIDDLMLTIKPSIGIAIYPTNGGTGQELVINADAAMYRAKKTQAGYVFFDYAQDQTYKEKE